VFDGNAREVGALGGAQLLRPHRRCLHLVGGGVPRRRVLQTWRNIVTLHNVPNAGHELAVMHACAMTRETLFQMHAWSVPYRSYLLTDRPEAQSKTGEYADAVGNTLHLLGEQAHGREGGTDDGHLLLLQVRQQPRKRVVRQVVVAV
jgi:hypothetical protein